MRANATVMLSILLGFAIVSLFFVRDAIVSIVLSPISKTSVLIIPPSLRGYASGALTTVCPADRFGKVLGSEDHLVRLSGSEWSEVSMVSSLSLLSHLVSSASPHPSMPQKLMVLCRL